MKLSPKQIEWINNERRHYIELIAAKESGGVSRGIGWDKSQLQMLQVIIALHNLEIGKKDETQTESRGEGAAEPSM
jgi:hypothetical protein